MYSSNYIKSFELILFQWQGYHELVELDEEAARLPMHGEALGMIAFRLAHMTNSFIKVSLRHVL